MMETFQMIGGCGMDVCETATFFGYAMMETAIRSCEYYHDTLIRFLSEFKCLRWLLF